MKRIFSTFCLCVLLAAVSGLRAQNIQLHYDFGRSLYDKDLKGRPLFTSTVEKFQPDAWGSTFFFIDMDYTSEGVASAYWEISRELKFWKAPPPSILRQSSDIPPAVRLRPDRRSPRAPLTAAPPSAARCSAPPRIPFLPMRSTPFPIRTRFTVPKPIP